MGIEANLTNEKIIEGFKSNNNEILILIYKNYYPVVERMIVYDYNGRAEDAKDIFQDALLTVYSALCTEPPLIIEFKFFTFLVSICRRRMIDKIRTGRIHVRLESAKAMESAPDVLRTITHEDRVRLIEKHFKELGEKCREILRMFLKGYSVSEVTLKLNMSNDQVTKNRRLKCKKELFVKIYNDPLLKELIDGKPWNIREIPKW